MRIGTAAGGLAIVLTLLAMADTDAAATWGYSASSGADCQLSIPTLDTKFRPKASGARNESTTASYFVICPARGFSSALDTVTQVVADFSYMPQEHLAEMAAEAPLPRLRQLMLDHQFSEAELDAIVADLDAQMDTAAEFAANSPLPGPEEIRKDVFAEEIAA